MKLVPFAILLFTVNKLYGQEQQSITKSSQKPVRAIGDVNIFVPAPEKSAEPKITFVNLPSNLPDVPPSPKLILANGDSENISIVNLPPNEPSPIRRKKKRKQRKPKVTTLSPKTSTTTIKSTDSSDIEASSSTETSSTTEKSTGKSTGTTDSSNTKFQSSTETSNIQTSSTEASTTKSSETSSTAASTRKPKTKRPKSKKPTETTKNPDSKESTTLDPSSDQESSTEPSTEAFSTKAPKSKRPKTEKPTSKGTSTTKSGQNDATTTEKSESTTSPIDANTEKSTTDSRVTTKSTTETYETTEPVTNENGCGDAQCETEQNIDTVTESSVDIDIDDADDDDDGGGSDDDDGDDDKGKKKDKQLIISNSRSKINNTIKQKTRVLPITVNLTADVILDLLGKLGQNALKEGILKGGLGGLLNDVLAPLGDLTKSLSSALGPIGLNGDTSVGGLDLLLSPKDNPLADLLGLASDLSAIANQSPPPTKKPKEKPTTESPRGQKEVIIIENQRPADEIIIQKHKRSVDSQSDELMTSNSEKHRKLIPVRVTTRAKKSHVSFKDFSRIANTMRMVFEKLIGDQN